MATRWQPLDEQDDGFGWALRERMRRTSHALRVDGRVWLIDPIDTAELEGRVRALGEPAGVLQLLDRHNRACAAWAERLHVPLRRAWEGVGDTPFRALRVCDNRFWREVALWEPQSRTLVCADALGTIPYFRADGERIGVHPLLRLRPPRALGAVAPERVLVGHGDGVHVDAAAAVSEALGTARRRLPRAIAGAVSAARRGSAAST
ncbi:MAG: hypothetical protein ACRDM1_00245 [Gaiellaceae bacterium]